MATRTARPTRQAAPHKSLKEQSDSDEEDVRVEAQQNSDEEDIVAPEVEKRKRPAKQNTKAPALEAVLGGALPTPPRKKKATAPIVIDAGNLTLLELLAKHPEAAAAAAKAWVTNYRNQPVPGTADLLSLVVQVAGACVVVTEQDVEEGDTDTLAARLADSVMQEGGCDPLHDRKTTRTLPGAFATFCTSLVAEMDEAELLAGSADDFALDKLLHIVMSLSSSNIRPFRLAATLCASCLVDGLVAARKKRTEALGTAQFQLDAEAKKGKAANQSLLKSLKQTLDSYQRQSDVLTAHITELIKTVFAVRFRDKQPEVRARVIYSIGHWVATDPASFLADTHLKYLGWALSDKEAIVRLNAVTAVLRLYQDTGNIQGLRDFRSRFLERMRELPYDVDETVAIRGLELLARLVALKEVEASQMHDVAALLADESPALRSAAAEVVAGVLAAQVEARVQELQTAQEEQAARGSTGTRSRTPAKGKAQAAAGAAGAQLDVKAATKQAQVVVLLDLMAWLQPAEEGQAASHGTSQPSAPPPLEEQVVGLLVDSLYDRYPILKDVGHLAHMLGTSEVMEGKVGGPAGPCHLATMLAQVVHRSVPAEAAGSKGATTAKPAARAARKKTSTATASHQELTQALMGPVPNLIRQYQTEPAVLAPLLQVAGGLQLEVFAMQGEERALGALLALVADQVLRHTDAQVLQMAAECLVSAATSGPGSLRAAAQLALDNVVSKVGQGLVSSAKAVSGLSKVQLASEVEELASSGGGVATEVHEGAEVLWRLKASLLRATALLTHGATQLAAHDANRSALARLLKEASSKGGAAGGSQPRASSGSRSARNKETEGPRALGADVLGLCLVASQAALMSDLVQMGVVPDSTDKPGDKTKEGAVPASQGEPAQPDSAPSPAAKTGKGGKKQATGKGGKGKGRGRRGKVDVEAVESEGGSAEESEQEGEEAAGGNRKRTAVGGATLEKSKKRLREGVKTHAECLRDLYEVCETDPTSRELIMRAISDLVLLFGHNVWKGTAAAGVGVPDDVAADLVGQCWDCCQTILDNALVEEQTLSNPDEDEEIDVTVADAKASARVALAARRVLALGVPVRLLLTPTVLAADMRDWLASRVLAQIAFHGAETKQLIKDVVVMLRRQQQQEADASQSPVPPMSERLLGALLSVYDIVMQESEAQELAQTQAMESGNMLAVVDTEKLEAALNTLQQLAVELASLFPVAGVHRDEVVGLMKRGVSWVLECDDPRPHMYLTAWALTHFIPKLTPDDARQLVVQVQSLMRQAEEVAPRHEADPETGEEVQDPNWAQVDHFLSQLEERAAKGRGGAEGGKAGGRARGALKGSRAAAKAAADADTDMEDAGGAAEDDGGAPSTGKGAKKRGRGGAGRGRKKGDTWAPGQGAAEEGSEGEEERARPTRRARFAGPEEDPVVGRRAPAEEEVVVPSKRKGGRGKQAKEAPEGWHVVDKNSPAKRRARQLAGHAPVAELVAPSESEHEEEDYEQQPQQEDQEEEEDVVPAKNTRRALFGSLPMSEDDQLPRFPTAVRAARKAGAVSGRFAATTPSHAADDDDDNNVDGDGDHEMLAASPSEGQPGQQAQEEGGDEGEEEGEEDGEEEEEGDSDGEGGVSYGAAPSQSTQVSEPPPRAVRRRRI